MKRMSSSSNTQSPRRRNSVILSAEDYPDVMIRSQSTSEFAGGRTASGSGGVVPNSKTNKTLSTITKHSTVTVETPAKIERVETDTTETISVKGNEYSERTISTSIAFDDQRNSSAIAVTTVSEEISVSLSNKSKKQQSTDTDSLSSKASSASSINASSTKHPATRYGELGTSGTIASAAAFQRSGPLSNAAANYQPPSSVAFDPSTQEFTYLITVPRQLVDIHSVASVVRTTGEAARLKHLLQYVADRYAPVPAPTLSATNGSASLYHQNPLLYASNSACLQQGSNVTVEIALTEGAIIDKSVYSQHERRSAPAQQQQTGPNANRF